LDSFQFNEEVLTLSSKKHQSYKKFNGSKGILIKTVEKCALINQIKSLQPQAF